MILRVISRNDGGIFAGGQKGNEGGAPNFSVMLCKYESPFVIWIVCYGMTVIIHAEGYKKAPGFIRELQYSHEVLMMIESHSGIINNQLVALEMTEAPPSSPVAPQIELVSRRRQRIPRKLSEMAAVHTVLHS